MNRERTKRIFATNPERTPRNLILNRERTKKKPIKIILTNPGERELSNQEETKMGANGKKPKTYAITQEEIEELVKKAADAGIEAYKKAEKKAREKAAKDIIVRVRKVLETYRALKNDLLHSEYETDVEQTELRFKCVEDLMSPGDTNMDDVMTKEIERLKRNAWSKRQIERAIFLLEEDCRKEGKPEAMRRYRVIIALYIQDKKLSYEEIAEQENVVERTVYKDASDACEMIAPYLLNIDKVPDIS